MPQPTPAQTAVCTFRCNCPTNPPQPLNLGFTAYYPHLWLSYSMMTPDNRFHAQMTRFCSKVRPGPPNSNSIITPQTLTLLSSINKQTVFRSTAYTRHSALAVLLSTVFIKHHTTSDQIVYNPMLLLLDGQAMSPFTLNIPRRLHELVRYIKVHSQQPTL